MMKLHEELKGVCEDNGIIMLDYYNFYDMLEDPALYMVFDMEAFIIDMELHAEEYREKLKDGAEHKIELEYLYRGEGFVKVAMRARLMTEEEKMQRECLKKFNII